MTFIFVAQYAKKSNASLDKKGKLAISLSSGLALVVLVTLLYWLLRRQRKGKQLYSRYFIEHLFHLTCSARTHVTYVYND